MASRANKSISRNNSFESLLLRAIAMQLRDTKRRVALKVRYAVWFGRLLSRSRTACLSRALARLEARGFVARLPGQRLRLTNAGRARLTAELGELWVSATS